MQIDLHVNNTQMKKIQNGKSFQLSYDDILQDNRNITLNFNKKSDYTRLMKNLRNGKGFRFSPNLYHVNDMHGGSLFDDFKNAAKNKGKELLNKAQQKAQKEAQKYAEKAQQQAQNYATQAQNMATKKGKKYQKATENFAQEQMKKGEHLVKKHANLFLNEAENFATNKANDLSQKAYSKADEYGKKANAKFKSMTGGKLQKGSQEAKDKMARLREMKGGKLPKWMRKATKAVSKGVSKGVNLAKDMAEDHVRGQVMNFYDDHGADILKQGSKYAVDGGIEALKAGTRYVAGDNELLMAQYDKLGRIANKKLDNALDKQAKKSIEGGRINSRFIPPKGVIPMHLRDPIKGGSVNKITGTIINPYSNEALHYPIVKNKIKGGGFLQQ
mgnify:CR=1 FL=1